MGGWNGAARLHKGKDYLIFFLIGTSDRWVWGFGGGKIAYSRKIFRKLVKKGLSAEAYLEPLFQKSQKNLEHLKSLKHNSHPCPPVLIRGEGRDV